jgi:lipoate-protein ligase A
VANFGISEWYLWECESHPGAFNMMADHFLARRMGGLLDRPLLRFFKWQPYCISLGYHQNVGEIDREACRESGIDVVRRPTGGRAILHAEELTYSIVYPFGSLDVSDFYRLTHLPFVEALCDLGMAAEFRKSQADFKSFYKSDRSSVCFATAAQYEVEMEGKKLIGSAQRVYENSILQHGSLLLGPYHEKIVNFLNIPENKREVLADYIRSHTAHLAEFNADLAAEFLAAKITEGFERMFGIRFKSLEENSAIKSALADLSGENQFNILQVQAA